jgi:predicted lipoprotein with Yx(FWY)xxD motif
MRLAIVVSLLLVLAAGCGGEMGSASAQPERAGSPTLRIVNSKYGRIIADAKGQAIYLFTRDGRGSTRCYGACAEAWPPLITRGKPRVGAGLLASRVGTTRRRDGRLQVTYRGQPLYYYVADKPGVILCQNVNEFGGDWLVVAPSGRAVR